MSVNLFIYVYIYIFIYLDHIVCSFFFILYILLLFWLNNTWTHFALFLFIYSLLLYIILFNKTKTQTIKQQQQQQQQQKQQQYAFNLFDCRDSFPGDVLAIQTRMTGTRYISSSSDDKHFSAPPFHLPVVYQDDHFAIVNKPEGIVVFGSRNGGHGRQTVKAALPYALNPPEVGVVSVMRRPQPVHRLDRATSGLLLVAKTKPAMTELSRQFKDRRVKKTCECRVDRV